MLLLGDRIVSSAIDAEESFIENIHVFVYGLPRILEHGVDVS